VQQPLNGVPAHTELQHATQLAAAAAAVFVTSQALLPLLLLLLLLFSPLCSFCLLECCLLLQVQRSLLPQLSALQAGTKVLNLQAVTKKCLSGKGLSLSMEIVVAVAKLLLTWQKLWAQLRIAHSLLT
jgi:hypothetical protein